MSGRAAPLTATAAASHAADKARVIAQLVAENDWKNSLVLWMLPAGVRDAMPRVLRSWFRNYVGCMALYLGVGSAWAYYIYVAFGRQLFPSGKVPGAADMAEQIKVAMCSIPMYALLPALVEAVVERGWTRAYAHISDVGVPRYLMYFALYMTSVEFFVYWMHRLLHDIRPGYKYLHFIHHKYNKEHTLSPFAGLAFHPLDGILQAIPYAWTLLYCPMHFLTHELLLFATGVWTTNIHDCVDGRLDPVMGAAFHTIHHTTYKHNYGHYTTYFDRLFGTLVTPEEFEAQQRQQQQQQQQKQAS